ncbi:MAG TPA: protein kinase [Kofleriaceae bacterium]|nr:protein kinase [Kofleriaceae bacterium]
MSTVVAEVGSTASNYLVLAKLAVGGMAEIFLARGASAAGLQRYVVLKRILRDQANNAEFVAMFLEEARLAAQLQHPNVAQVYDIGKLGDSYFFTMEYVHGETVRSLMYRTTEQQREVPLSVVLSVIAGAAAGLHHAHERVGVDGRPLGIVHRDVSPSNLMISYEGSVKVVDFGVAKAESRAVETRSGTVKGKVSYLSPEQCRGLEVDRRSDLFSLGIVMWEMLVGDRLYRRGSDFEIMTAIVSEEVLPPSHRRRGIPPELDALVLRLLAKKPKDRFQTCDEAVDALEQVAAKIGVQLSANALGRYMREVFGTRKEPWLELEAEQDGVTVIGEPVPAPPTTSQPSQRSVDEQLDELEDLSVRVPYSESSVPLRRSMAQQAQPAPRMTGVTAAARPQAVHRRSTGTTTAEGLAALEGHSTVVTAEDEVLAAEAARADMLAAVPLVRSTGYARAGTQPEPILQDALPPIAATPPPPLPYPIAATPGPMSAAQARTVYGYATADQQAYPAAAPRGSSPNPPMLQPNAPVPAEGGQREGTAFVRRPTRSVVVIVTASIAIVAGVAIALSMSGGASSSRIPDDGAPAASSQPVERPVSPPAPPSAGAASQAATAASDAPGPSAAAPPAVPVAPATPAERVARASAEGRFSDAVAVCDDELASEIAAACTIAACNTSDASRAKKWFARVAAGERTKVTAACKTAGVAVPPRARSTAKPTSGTGACALDPMSCQH